MSNYGLIRFIRFVSRFIDKLCNTFFISSRFNSTCRCRKKIRILNSVTKQGACHLRNLGGLGRWSCSFCWTMLPPAGTCLVPRPRRTAFHIPWFIIGLASGIPRSTQTPAFGKKKGERKVKETEWASACTSLAAWRLCPMRFSLSRSCGSCCGGLNNKDRKVFFL